MLTISDLKSFAESYVQERANLENHFIIANDSEYSSYMRDVINDGNLMSLVILLPTFDSRIIDEDNRKIGNNLYFMIVKKTDSKAGYDEKIKIFERTQLEMMALNIRILNLHRNWETCEYQFFKEIELQSLRIDPVNNYHSTNGWEMEFSTLTQLRWNPATGSFDYGFNFNLD